MGVSQKHQHLQPLTSLKTQLADDCEILETELLPFAMVVRSSQHCYRDLGLNWRYPLASTCSPNAVSRLSDAVAIVNETLGNVMSDSYLIPFLVGRCVSKVRRFVADEHMLESGTNSHSGFCEQASFLLRR